MKKLIPYLHPDHGSINEVESELLDLARTRDIFTMYIVWMVLSNTDRVD